MLFQCTDTVFAWALMKPYACSRCRGKHAGTSSGLSQSTTVADGVLAGHFGHKTLTFQVKEKHRVADAQLHSCTQQKGRAPQE